MSKRSKQQIELSTKFQPQFCAEADRRTAIVKEIARRVSALKREIGADSVQKVMLCERIVFMQLQLETQERQALEKGCFDLGVYTQGLNCFVGLLRAVGLGKHVKNVSEAI